ncbi:MAG TPA: transglutaminase-like domain-containing protein [Acidimicrobiales bacterium]|jgi:regulator of sirC expression with transglutaminase-like and TPR domain|nr:transglutaminase-like domain-containing protein [Acidimicrobiales bacterium]
MDPTARFTALVQGPEPAIPLDDLALLVAAHAYPSLDIGRAIDRLDDIAARCRERSFAGVMDHLFATEKFAGNHDDYYDPRNSFLNEVVDRHLGIPITLGILAMETGRRIGVPIVGIGMPGHFLVRDGQSSERYADPFSGRVLDRDGCRALFTHSEGAGDFSDDLLAPVGARAIVARLLANLKGIYLARRDRRSLAWVLKLRSEVPGVPLGERRELASALAADGRFIAAAEELDRLAELARQAGDVDLVEDSTRGATRLRARLN